MSISGIFPIDNWDFKAESILTPLSSLSPYILQILTILTYKSDKIYYTAPLF